MARTRPTQLSEKERSILNAIELLMIQSPYPPSIRDIGRQAKINAPSQVRFYLNALQEKGFIERDEHISRSIRLVKPVEAELPKPAVLPPRPRIPVLGRIQAGEPVPIPTSDFPLFDEESFIEISEKMLPRTTDPLYALEVSGDSMRDALVMHGDIVVLRSAHRAMNGQMVAAWLPQRNETTLKQYFLEGTQVRLQPANPEYRPIYLGVNEVEVQGLVVFIFRQFKPF